MALARIGGGVVEIAGAVGNDVYARNPFGVYIRENTPPVQPNTTSQINRRSQFADVVDLYQTLTAAQYISWSSLAANLTFKNRLGQPYRPSGYQVFISWNYNLHICGLAMNTTAPSMQNYDIQFTALITYDISAQTLRITSSSSGILNSYGVLEATAPQSNGTNFFKNQFRIIATYPPAAFNLTNFDIKPAYQAIFPSALPLTTLTNIRFRAHSIRNPSGEATYRVPVPFVVVP